MKWTIKKKRVTPGKDIARKQGDRVIIEKETEKETLRNQGTTVTGRKMTLIDLVDPQEQVEPPDQIDMNKCLDQGTGQEKEDTKIEALAETGIIVTEARAEREQEEMEPRETGRTTMGGGPEVLAGRPNVLGGLLQAPP